MGSATDVWLAATIDGSAIKLLIAAYLMLMGTGHDPRLTIGGLSAAPFAAMLTRRLHTKALVALLGTVIVLISKFNLYTVYTALV